MPVVAIGCGAVTCAGFGVGCMRDALYGCSDFEQGIEYRPGSAAAVCALGRFAFADALTELGLPQQLVAGAARTGSRASQAMQAAILAVGEAWHCAGLALSDVPRDRISLVVGGSNLTQVEHAALSRNEVRVQPSWAVRFLDTDHVGTLSAVFGIRGEGFTVGGASASGNVALAQARRLIVSGDADICVVVGSLMGLSAAEYEAFQAAGAMAVPNSIGERCNYPFDARRRGFVPGEGAGCIILESERLARSRGHRPLAILSAAAVRMDGERFTSPSAEGEAAVMEKVIHAAGISAKDVDYVNAHGTGSAVGDDTEMAALACVFGDRAGGPLVNSTKSIIGHTLSAAGVLESIATLIQCDRGVVHGTRNLEYPIATQPKLVVQQVVLPRLRFALSNGFAFGGINTAVLWEAM